MVTLQLRQLHVPPGQRLLIEDVTWADFEAIVEELGEHRGTRVAYSQGVLEIVSPLPKPCHRILYARVNFCRPYAGRITSKRPNCGGAPRGCVDRRGAVGR
jgi:hypothetical protein